MNPTPARKYVNQYFSKKKFSVRSIDRVAKYDQNISYPILSEYGIGTEMNFCILKWHDRYDALATVSNNLMQKLRFRN